MNDTLRLTIRPLWVLTLAAMAVGRSTDARGVHPKDGYVVTRDGVRIHYIEAGSGPPIVFVPGWAISADIWRHQIDWFAHSYHVVAIDARSQGRSSITTRGLYPEVRAADLRSVIRDRSLSPAVLVGWSMGAQDVAAYVAQYGTGDVAGLVFIDGTPGGGMTPDLARLLLAFMGQYQRDPGGTMDAFVRGLFATPQPESTLRPLILAAQRMPPLVAQAQYLGTITSDESAAIAKIDRPTLLISTDEEPIAGAMRAVHDRIPGSEVAQFPGAGHAMFVDRAVSFDSLLERFVARAVRSRSTPSRD